MSVQGAETAQADKAPLSSSAPGGSAEPGRDAGNPGDVAVATNAVDSAAEIAQAPPLWPQDEIQKLSERWERAQDAFVDKPRKGVEDADSLVTSVATRVAQMFAAERAKLEDQWDRDGEVSADELHTALVRYRAFFGRLLKV